MHPQDLTKENVEEILLSDIEQLDDRVLVEYGYYLQSVWVNLELHDLDMRTTLLCHKMKEVYNCVLTRTQNTNDLERLAVLVPSLPHLIYCPNLPEEEDCFEPVDGLVWGFAQRVCENPEVSAWIKDAAINSLMVETKGIDLEDLMAEQVYVWALKNKQTV